MSLFKMHRRLLSLVILPRVQKEMFKTNTMTMLFRNLSTKRLTPTIALLTNDSIDTKHLKRQPSLSEYDSQGRPLSIFLCWLMAKNNAVHKYAKFYLDNGYDVLTVRITPGQLIFPSQCTTIIDNELLPILQSSDHSQKLIHGFSVGGYIYAQMVKRLRTDPEKYRQLESTFFAQIWDSVVDVNGTSIGVSKSIFMNNEFLQKTLKKYIDLYLKIFYHVATKYYDEAHEYYYNQPIRSPALFLCSKIDQISTINTVHDIQASWTPMGIKSTTRMWDNTSHVGHMHKYPEEYNEAVRNFISSAGGKLRKSEMKNVFRPSHEGVSGAFNLNGHVVYMQYGGM